MSVLEMQKKEVIEKIAKIEDEQLMKQINDLINAANHRPSIKDIYNEAKREFGETLQKLAQ
jgi:hypothetical protein